MIHILHPRDDDMIAGVFREEDANLLKTPIMRRASTEPVEQEVWSMRNMMDAIATRATLETALGNVASATPTTRFTPEAVEALSRGAQDYAASVLEALVRAAKHRGNTDVRQLLADGSDLGESLVIEWGVQFDATSAQPKQFRAYVIHRCEMVASLTGTY
jgi:histone H3/H4